MRYPFGRRGEPALGSVDGVRFAPREGRVFFDVLGTPPRELLLLAPIAGTRRGARGAVPLAQAEALPEEEPPRKPRPESPEPERWFDDPRSDVIGWS